ncbi:WbqC family protein [Saccharicrinis sp. FJH2]|uniref:WbqC family protein n=1 Tax=Saccharicrinis sp. FJH65 TaxID=3344659 RepID=UPI0035F392A1
MKVAIMQPYFFPYIGYYQLIHSVDKFVIYDDVNYIKQGWISRNRVLSNGESIYFTLNLKGASSNKYINEIEVGDNKVKLLKTIKQNYSKASNFDSIFPLVETILNNNESNLAQFLTYSIKSICSFLEINTEIYNSVDLGNDKSLKGEEKVIDICKVLNADMYINSIGGKTLYSYDHFQSHNIELKFLKSREFKYNQFKNSFVPWLSIIDVMMFNSITEIRKYLEDYILI